MILFYNEQSFTLTFILKHCLYNVNILLTILIKVIAFFFLIANKT